MYPSKTFEKIIEMCTDKLLCCSVLILCNFIYICSAVLKYNIYTVSIIFAVIIYNFTKANNISLLRCAPLPLNIILFSVMNSSVINAMWRKVKYNTKYKYKMLMFFIT